MSRKNVKKSEKKPGIFSRVKGFFAKLFWPSMCVIFFILGGVVTNLDRLPSLPPKLIGGTYELLPSPIRRVIARYQPQFARGAANTEVKGRIIQVYDGDTATMLSEDGKVKYKIRFYGIDAPEAAQESGREAGNRLRELIDNRDVTVKVVSVDTYGRSVGKVYCGNIFINLQMVREGHAWYYANYAPREYELAGAMAKAKAARRGLWSRPNPTPPWEWRHK